MKILVTGGAGFIGHHLANKLASLGHSVTVFDNLYYNQKSVLSKEVIFINGDIRDGENLKKVCKNQDIVFHLAALANIRVANDNPEYCFSTNVTGTYNLLESLKDSDVKKIIFTSSREVYGEKSSLPVNEESNLEPVNLYGLTKVCGEDIIKFIASKLNIKKRIFRLANVYGPRDNVPGRVIPSFIKAAKESGEMNIRGGEQILDFVWIEDVINVLISAIETDSEETMNIGSGIGITIKDLAHKINGLYNTPVKIKITEHPTGEISKFIADITKIKIKPTPLDDGLKNMLN